MSREELTDSPKPDIKQVGRTAVAGNAEAYGEIGNRIRRTKTVMAEKFGVAEEDFAVVVSEGEAERKAVLVYAAPNGLIRGSWNNIFNPRNEHMFRIRIDDEDIDTRAGMTWEVYQGMVNGLTQGKLIDASVNRIKSDTWLTGEGVAGEGLGGEMRFMASNDWGNSPELISGYAASDRENVDEIRTFRPSVVLHTEPLIK